MSSQSTLLQCTYCSRSVFEICLIADIHRDETVEIGAQLYEMDTEGTATVDATSTAAKSPEEPSSSEAAATASPTATTSSSQSERIPSIKFLGKEGWEAVRTGVDPHTTASTTTTSPHDSSVVVLQDDSVHSPMYGRPAFTEEEIEAMITGGATVAPDVVWMSSGAKFSAALT